MTDKITLEEALELVTFTQNDRGEWEVEDVIGNVNGDVWGNVEGSVCGYVGCSVGRNVICTVEGDIKSDEWQRVKTPNPTGGPPLWIELYNQQEDN